MECTICGKEIPSIFDCYYPEEANYFQMENGDVVCTDEKCRMTHMKENITEEQKATYFKMCEELGIHGLAEIAALGLDQLPPWELDEMLEYYESGNTFELTNETFFSPGITA